MTYTTTARLYIANVFLLAFRSALRDDFGQMASLDT
jgi:hypothetical protein